MPLELGAPSGHNSNSIGFWADNAVEIASKLISKIRFI